MFSAKCGSGFQNACFPNGNEAGFNDISAFPLRRPAKTKCFRYVKSTYRKYMKANGFRDIYECAFRGIFSIKRIFSIKKTFSFKNPFQSKNSIKFCQLQEPIKMFFKSNGIVFVNSPPNELQPWPFN